MLKKIGVFALAGVVVVALLLAVWSPALSFRQADLAEEARTASSEEIATDPVVAARQQTDDAPQTQLSAQQDQPSQPLADVPSSDNCIACHIDKEQLKAVAEEPEEVKSEETSGEG